MPSPAVPPTRPLRRAKLLLAAAAGVLATGVISLLLVPALVTGSFTSATSAKSANAASTSTASSQGGTAAKAGARGGSGPSGTPSGSGAGTTTAGTTGSTGSAGSTGTSTSPPVSSTSQPPASGHKPSGSTSAGLLGVSYPLTPPAAICGNSLMLIGPVLPPAGAIVVPPGNDTTYQPMFTNDPGKTFYFTSGIHLLGANQYSQILPANNTTFIGGPGAVLSGQGINDFAFTQTASNVTIEYLTIENFVAPLNQGVVNTNSGTGWTIKYNTITKNQGAGVFAGPNNTVAYNCISDNGQYGFQMVDPTVDDHGAVIDHNEIAGNNTANTEVANPGCGCSGGGKIWSTMGGSITNNWVHDNKGPGIWADTNNAGILISGNYISNNDQEAIIYELSYNAQITGNNIVDNGWVLGKQWQAQGNTYPSATIYISNSGGDSRVDGGLYSTFAISGNNLDNNWGGIQLFQDANRFCGSTAEPSTWCTLVNPAATLKTCAPGTINQPPYSSDCQWKVQNISVFDNTFSFNPSTVGCNSVSCGMQSIIASVGSAPSWSPYLGTGLQRAITTQQNNKFYNNAYTGTWKFEYSGTLQPDDFNQWQGSPTDEDAASTMNGANSPPTLAGNLLDADSYDQAGSVGFWADWFNSSVARTTSQHQSGTTSLQVTLTQPNSWAIQMFNWTGYAKPGPMSVTFWGLAGASNKGKSSAGLGVKWLDSNNKVLGTATATINTLTGSWQQASVSSTAPTGTAYVQVQLGAANTSAATGDTFYFNQFYVGSQT